MVKHIVKGLYNLSEFLLMRSLDVSELGFKIESFFNNETEENEVVPEISHRNQRESYNNKMVN